MQLHELKIKPNKSKKRIGRGGKRGTTSGRGQKGQKSRSGHRIRPALRDLLIRIPKLRGFKNKSLNAKYEIISLTVLGRIEGSEASMSSLKSSGLISKSYKGNVKILGDGEIGRPITVIGLSVSKSARKKIEKAGGSIK